jgi:hypothetical protein
MAKVQISDVVVPEVFVPYVIEKTAELSRFVQAGIVQGDPDFDRRVNEGGRTINMPFWQDLTGEEEVLSDGTSLTTAKITTSRDVAGRLIRGKAWSYNDLAKMLAGSDPAAAIGNLVADYRARRMQACVLSLLKGVFSAASMAGNALDIHITSGGGTPTLDNVLNGETFIDAKQLMGDSKDKLVAIAMHSAVEAMLLKLDLIDFVPDSTGKSTLNTFQGLQVVIDDGLTTETVDSKTVYSTYLFGRGALALGNGSDNSTPDGAAPGSTWEVEFARTALAGDSVMIHRWKQILHPRGIKYLDADCAGVTPTNTELSNGANWLRVFEAKNIRIVRLRHNLLG